MEQLKELKNLIMDVENYEKTIDFLEKLPKDCIRLSISTKNTSLIYEKMIELKGDDIKKIKDVLLTIFVHKHEDLMKKIAEISKKIV